MNHFDILENGAKRFSAREAICFHEATGTRSLSYGEVHRLAVGFSAALARTGVRKGDRVAVFLPNVPEYPAVTNGALRIGAVPVLLSSALKADKLQEHVKNSQASVLVTSEDLYAETAQARECPSLREMFVLGDASPGARSFREALAFEGDAPPKVVLGPDEPAMILYTSGTTGEQKGAVLSHANILSNIRATAHCTGMTGQDRILCFLPLFHCFGQNFVMNSTFLAGGTLVLHKRFVLEEILASLR
ncbi:MAG: AMP-binding protein, partial [Bryobacteraceae bacterium]